MANADVVSDNWRGGSACVKYRNLYMNLQNRVSQQTKTEFNGDGGGERK